MIISFDIDGTLIPYSDEFSVEKKPVLAKILGAESIRKGTKSLFKELERNGHDIWIYTTSSRSPWKIRKTFSSFGLYPRNIINEKINRKCLDRAQCSSSKNPSLFGIDIHVDDSKGVELEGEKYNFKTIIVETDNEDWVNYVLDKIRIEENKLTN